MCWSLAMPVRMVFLGMLLGLGHPAHGAPPRSGGEDSTALARDGAPSQDAGQGARVAVYPLKSLGLDPETLDRLEQVLRGEIGRVPGITLVDAAESQEQATRLPCAGKDRCLGDFARSLKSGLAVYGVVGALGKSYNITLRSVDGAGRASGRVQVQVGGEQTVLIDGIRGAAYRLLRPDLYVGKLELQIPVQGAEVQLDGKSLGRTPLEGPVQGLKPGKHALKIVSKGYSDFDRFVEVRFQRTSVVGVDLKGNSVSGVIFREEPPPPLVAITDLPSGALDGVPGIAGLPCRPVRSHLRTWIGLGLGGVGLFLAGGGVSLALVANENAGRLENRWASGGGPSLEDVGRWKDFQQQASSSRALYTGAGAAAIIGGGLVLWDLLSDEDSLRPLPSLNPGAPGLALTGRF